MTTKTKKLAALLMSGIMTLSIAPVVHEIGRAHV